MKRIRSVQTRLRAFAGLFPLTARGVVALLCVALALRFFGYGAMDLMVFALGICALAILLTCLFSVVVCGLILQRRIQREAGDESGRQAGDGKAFEAGFPNQTGFTLAPVGLLPLVRLQWSWQYPDRVGSRIRVAEDERLEEEIAPRLRCLSGHVTRRFVVSDVLGLCRYSWRLRRERECYVLPRVNTLKNLPLLHSLTAEDGMPRQSGEPVGDRMEIRPYVAGDSVRDILWKNYARTRQLNVRQRERSVARGKRILAYLLAGPGDEAAAAVARAALESGAFGDDWQFSADGTETPCDDLESSLRAVARSRALGAPHAPGLERFLAAADQRGATHCIVFAGGGTISGLAGLGGGAFRGKFSLVLGTDGMEEPKRRPAWSQLLLRPAETSGGDGRGRGRNTPQTRNPPQPGAGPWDGGSGGSRGELLVLCRQLGPAVESIILVDRTTGTCYDDKLRKI